jgi:hypothetical protein
VHYWSIAGKDVGADAHSGELLGISLSEAELKGPHIPAQHANIKLRFLDRSGEEMRDDVYGKVVGEGAPEGAVRICLTALPPAVEQFLRGILYWQE